MDINHITLSTGHLRQSPRSEVDDAVLAWVSPWLNTALASRKRTPLPLPELAHYSALGLVEDGALVVSVYGPSGPHSEGRAALGGTGTPLVTLGVAQRPEIGQSLWAMMGIAFPVQAGLQKPAEPWCAVAVHPSAIMYLESITWLADFERCVAWSWITRNPALSAVNKVNT